MPPAPKGYTPAEKSHALDLYREHGPREAAKRTGISVSTIARWARKAGVRTEVVTKTHQATVAAAAKNDLTREGLKTKLLEKAHGLLDRLDVPEVSIASGKSTIRGAKTDFSDPSVKAPADASRNVAVAVGILIDKYELLTGGATTRIEQPAPSVEQLIRMRDEIAARRGIKVGSQ